MDEENKTEPVMYIFMNKGLGLSPGKLASQVAHAAVKASDMSDKKLRDDWNKFGFYTKLIMEARNEEHLKTIQKYLEDREIKTAMIIDEGRTEIDAHQATALGVEIIDKNEKGEIFKAFQLYKPEIEIKVKFN